MILWCTYVVICSSLRGAMDGGVVLDCLRVWLLSPRELLWYVHFISSNLRAMVINSSDIPSVNM